MKKTEIIGKDGRTYIITGTAVYLTFGGQRHRYEATQWKDKETQETGIEDIYLDYSPAGALFKFCEKKFEEYLEDAHPQTVKMYDDFFEEANGPYLSRKGAIIGAIEAIEQLFHDEKTREINLTKNWCSFDIDAVFQP